MKLFGKYSQKTNLRDFMGPWAKLMAAYPRTEITEATTVLYHERLARYDLGLIMAAVNMAIDKCTFFPTVAEIIESIEAVTAATIKKRPALLDEPRPSKEEARAVLAELRRFCDKLQRKGEK